MSTMNTSSYISHIFFNGEFKRALEFTVHGPETTKMITQGVQTDYFIGLLSK